MQALRVTILRFVDDHQPGFVECTVHDAHGREHRFVEKAPVVSAEALGPDSTYPCAGVIACTVVDQLGEVATVDLEHPWGVETTRGERLLRVKRERLVELDDAPAP